MKNKINIIIFFKFVILILVFISLIFHLHEYLLIKSDNFYVSFVDNIEQTIILLFLVLITLSFSVLIDFKEKKYDILKYKWIIYNLGLLIILIFLRIIDFNYKLLMFVVIICIEIYIYKIILKYEKKL